MVEQIASTTATKPEETNEQMYYRLLMSLLMRIQGLGAAGVLNPTDLMSRELRDFWSAEKAEANNSMSQKAREKEIRREKNAARDKLSPRERRLLGVD